MSTLGLTSPGWTCDAFRRRFRRTVRRPLRRFDPEEYSDRRERRVIEARQDSLEEASDLRQQADRIEAAARQMAEGPIRSAFLAEARQRRDKARELEDGSK